MTLCPLVVDLDGTLIKTDMLYESILALCYQQPLKIPQMLWWLTKGMATFKQKLANAIKFNPAIIPYNQLLLQFLQEQRALGRHLILCSGTNIKLAQAIADHLQIFSEVIASDGTINLIGSDKATALTKRFGVKGFDYAGNANSDLAVWQQAKQAIVVNASQSLLEAASAISIIAYIVPAAPHKLSHWQRALRPAHWVKNILLFVPLLTSLHIKEASAWWALGKAFIAFSLCASAVYIINDLLDLASDRHHPYKRQRPFSCGQLQLSYGMLLIPILLLISFSLACMINNNFLICLSCYLVLTCAYSLFLKPIILVDCFTLTILYTLRVIAGSVAITQPLSFWLITLPMFIFLSLALIKRYAELTIQLNSGKQKIHGRGYCTTDTPLLQTMGISSGYAAILVLALYLNTGINPQIYRNPALIWGTIPVTFFWLNWLWLQAHRNKIRIDPVIFAMTARPSLISGIIFLLLMIAGTIGLPW
jgi:4-hydroxybenzoate polyprenyltransferase/phosphoserine phosphatase